MTSFNFEEYRAAIRQTRHPAPLAELRKQIKAAQTLTEGERDKLLRLADRQEARR